MSAVKKRRRECEFSELERLTELVDLDYDRKAIDELVAMYASTNASGGKSTDDIICCPRSYEESFLHEPIGTQRPCARNNECEGLKLQGTDGFILREFIYPGAKACETRQLCLLCRRHEISTTFYRYETGQNIQGNNLRVSRHYNLVGIAGEYDVRDCIVNGSKFSGLVLPVVLHIRSAYTCHMKDGVRHLMQSRMRCPGRSNPSEPGGFLGRRAGLMTNLAHSDLLSAVELS